MDKILETDADGIISVPPEVLGRTTPHMRYIVEYQANGILLRPEKQAPVWKTAPIAEWVDVFSQWISSHSTGPGLSDAAISRDTIYD